MLVTWFTWDTRCRGDSLLLFNHISIVGFEGLRGKRRKKNYFCVYVSFCRSARSLPCDVVAEPQTSTLQVESSDQILNLIQICSRFWGSFSDSFINTLIDTRADTRLYFIYFALSLSFSIFLFHFLFFCIVF